jgi:ABC-type sugar transport system permease subunit
VTPMIWPTLSVSIINSFTLIFTFFLQVQLITGGGPNQSTETIAFLINSQVENGFLNWAATIGVFFSLLATPLILLIRKGMDVISKKFGY